MSFSLQMSQAGIVPSTIGIASAVVGFTQKGAIFLIDWICYAELTVATATIGANPGSRLLDAPALEPLQLETVPLSRHEVDYPAMREMHAASSLASADEVRDWREQRTPDDQNYVSDMERGKVEIGAEILLRIGKRVRKEYRMVANGRGRFLNCSFFR